MKKIKSVSHFVAAVANPDETVEHWNLKTYRELDMDGRELPKIIAIATMKREISLYRKLNMQMDRVRLRNLIIKKMKSTFILKMMKTMKKEEKY